jgi:hypothetical protein
MTYSMVLVNIFLLLVRLIKEILKMIGFKDMEFLHIKYLIKINLFIMLGNGILGKNIIMDK